MSLIHIPVIDYSNGEGEVWYRYEDHGYAPPVDEFDRICGESRIEVRLYQLPVKKHTPKGVWLGGVFSNKRFVLRDANKRYACPTKEEARESFLARKRKQMRIYQQRIRKIATAISYVMTGDEIASMYDVEDV